VPCLFDSVPPLGSQLWRRLLDSKGRGGVARQPAEASSALVQAGHKKVDEKSDSALVRRSPTAATSGLLSAASNMILRGESTDVFLSHNWGLDEEGRDNHLRVRAIAKGLRKRGLSTWLDEEKLEGPLLEQLSEAIDSSRIVLVFVTQMYLQKVGRGRSSDNCKLEFKYAARRREGMLIPCVMEPSLLDTRDWSGPVGMVLGGDLYIDLSDESRLEEGLDALAQRVRRRLQANENRALRWSLLAWIQAVWAKSHRLRMATSTPALSEPDAARSSSYDSSEGVLSQQNSSWIWPLWLEALWPPKHPTWLDVEEAASHAAVDPSGPSDLVRLEKLIDALADGLANWTELADLGTDLRFLERRLSKKQASAAPVCALLSQKQKEMFSLAEGQILLQDSPSTPP